MPHNLARAARRADPRDSLTADESEWPMNEIMEGAATPSQIAGFGIALRIKGTSVAEMTGLARSMLAHATPIRLTGQLTDLVGTGGDGRTRQHLDHGHDRGRRGRGADGQARQPGRVVGVRGGGRTGSRFGVVINLPPSATAELAAEVGVAFLFRAAVSPGAAARGPDPQRARRADRVQLPRAGGPTRPCLRPRRSGGGSADGRDHRRRAGRARLLGAGVPPAKTGSTS